MGVHDSFVVDLDLGRIDLDRVHGWLSTDASWALGRSRETVEIAARNSLNLGVYNQRGVLCGYARIVTDMATFAWLCDVYVDPSFRGLGVGRLIASTVVEVLSPMDLKRVMLCTTDAHALYEQVGFAEFPYPHELMLLQ